MVNSEQIEIYLYVSSAAVALMFFLFLIWKKFFPKKNKRETPLFRPETNFARKILNALSGASGNVSEILPRIEEILITADVGVLATQRLIEKTFSNGKISSANDAIANLKTEIRAALSAKTDFVIDRTKKPFVIYMVGVNGVGKTTTIGKLAARFKSDGLSVTLVAADTFRAAAVEQLKIWSERNGVGFFGGAQNADPASVIVDGLRHAVAKNSDVVLVDTAGRLHTKANLMEELKKMVRMSEKVVGRNPDEIFLVVDAITGQNGFQQAKVFLEAIPVSGVVLTKYDATSKGGIIIAIADQTGIPIRFVGLGEKIEDLKPFHAGEFVERLFAA